MVSSSPMVLAAVGVDGLAPDCQFLACLFGNLSCLLPAWLLVLLLF